MQNNVLEASNTEPCNAKAAVAVLRGVVEVGGPEPCGVVEPSGAEPCGEVMAGRDEPCAETMASRADIHDAAKEPESVSLRTLSAPSPSTSLPEIGAESMSAWTSPPADRNCASRVPLDTLGNGRSKKRVPWNTHVESKNHRVMSSWTPSEKGGKPRHVLPDDLCRDSIQRQST